MTFQTRTLVTQDSSNGTSRTINTLRKLTYMEHMSSNCVANIDLTVAVSHRIHVFLFIIMQLISAMLAYIMWHYDFGVPLSLMLLVYIFSIFYLHFEYVINENVIVVRGLGLQLTKTYFTGRKVEQFFPSSCIRDIMLRQTVNVHRVVDFVGVRACDLNDEIIQSSIGLDIKLERQLLSRICMDMLIALVKPKFGDSAHG